MLDIAVSYNRYKFLGHEFLTWLWYVIEKERGGLENQEGKEASLEIGNRVVLENRRNEKLETITITGDDAGLEEGMVALRKGAAATELNLVYKENELEWRFNLKGESLGISSLRCPTTGPIENNEDLEGAVLERIYLYEKVVNLVENLYKQFIVIRLGPTWKSSVVRSMRKWMKE
jgi:hypothetical protein